MLAVIQFRQDQSGPHELKALSRSGGVSPERLLAIDAVAPNVTPSVIAAHIDSADGVLICGWGDNGYEEQGADKKEQLANVRIKMKPVIEHIVAAHTPTLGICFGHQILAETLGGSITSASEQAETGVGEIFLTEEGKRDFLFQDFNPSLRAVVGHKSSVANLPRGSVHLAYSTKSPHQAFRYGDTVYGVQFHPELDQKGLSERLALYPGYEKDMIPYSTSVSINAQRILKRFFEKVR